MIRLEHRDQGETLPMLTQERVFGRSRRRLPLLPVAVGQTSDGRGGVTVTFERAGVGDAG